MDEDKIVLPEPPAELLQNNQPEPVAVPEPQPEPVAEQESEPAPEPEQGETEQKKSASNRIKELSQQNKSLKDRLEEITQVPPLPQNTFVPQYNPGEEITQERLQTDIAKAADAKIDIRIAQERAINRINNESLDVVRKYPQLDPTSDQFDSELSDTIVEATEAMVRANPYSASVSKFVERLMKPYQNAVSKEVGKQTQTVAKQVSQSALRPTSVRQPEKPASEQSLAELEQKLGIVHS